MSRQTLELTRQQRVGVIAVGGHEPEYILPLHGISCLSVEPERIEC
ncbi:hypothetical protein SAMN05216604_105166 [Pseudomonas agarici]|nr:hypothetical protein SAMN05216604_105166 [Pseudomonas agarici]